MADKDKFGAIREWIEPDASNGLYNGEPGPWVWYLPDNETIDLDGKFTAPQLRALAEWMNQEK